MFKSLRQFTSYGINFFFYLIDAELNVFVYYSSIIRTVICRNK